MTIAGYEILSRVASGGMSTVYKARQSTLGRSVALKVYEGDNSDTDALERFILEAQILGELAHPGIIRIYELGTDNTRPFMSIEYVDTGTLTDLMNQQALKPANALRITRKLAFSLMHLHQRGIIHRDVKPDNILMRERDPVLSDFGIAIRIESAYSEVPAGSPHYLSPEQARGGAIDGRADLYSLGVTLYQMLTGKRPFFGKTASELAEQHIHVPVPTLPAEVVRFQPIIDRLMAKHPNLRYQNARVLIRDLKRLGRLERESAKVIKIGKEKKSSRQPSTIEDSLQDPLALQG